MKLAATNNPESFAGSITQKETLVYDVRAVTNDEQRYFIIRVLSAKQAAFLRAVEKDAGFRLEDYGDILYRGWDEPEDDLKASLREQYGMAYPEEQACSDAEEQAQ
jgi:hypothetical protein